MDYGKDITPTVLLISLFVDIRLWNDFVVSVSCSLSEESSCEAIFSELLLLPPLASAMLKGFPEYNDVTGTCKTFAVAGWSTEEGVAGIQGSQKVAKGPWSIMTQNVPLVVA